MSRKQRRAFSAEYKAEVVALVKQSDKPAERIAKELDLLPPTVRRWVREAEKELAPTNSKTLSDLSAMNC